MILSEFTYKKPKSLEEALDLLSDTDDSKIIAGGQSLIPLMKMGLTGFEQLVDISQITDLKSVKVVDDFVEIGSMVRHCDLENYDVIVSRLPILIKIASQIGDPQVRHRGTIGGAIAHGDPASDLAGCFVALKGSVVLSNKKGIREISANDFYKGFLETGLNDDEIIVSIKFPLNFRDAEFFKVSKRAQDWAISGLVTAKFKDELNLGLISMGSTTLGVSVRISDLYDNFESTFESIESVCSPTQDIYATKNFRFHLLRVFLRGYMNKHPI